MRYARRMNPMQPLRYPTAIRRWLTLCLILIALMVCVGGVTRLTESGLSIVEWKLISGTLPPMNAQAWQTEFDAYKLTPQFKQVNANFTIADFQQIFWLEYIHRLLGRIIGLAVFLPLVYLTLRRALPRPLFKRMVAVTILVAAQGTVGWVMVASGLHDEPRVEPLKLALHLLLAFSVFALLLWTRWQVTATPRLPAPRPVAIAARALLALVVLQITFGALVAGLRAGYYFNNFPLMDGQLIPAGLGDLTPWWRNHLENIMTVQFQHRIGAFAVFFGVLGFVIYSWKKIPHHRLLKSLVHVVILQFILGVATLLSTVDIALASMHQLVALLLFSLLIRLVYLTPFDPNQHIPQNAA